jgi:magnesium chelatase accessory protein
MELPEFWPHREHSQFVTVGGLRWHVQIMGKGPVILMLHGTGASAHSWADLAEQLKHHYTVVIPDLPGQGFTDSPPSGQATLEGFAERLTSLMAVLGVHPKLIVGHSAGAAIATHMALNAHASPAAVLAINGAFLPFGAAAAPAFNRIARWMSRSKLLAYVTAAHGLFELPVRNMLLETGSQPSEKMLRCYQQLLASPRHVLGTLAMMAGWNLSNQRERLPGLRIPLHLITCANDRTVDPWQAERLSEFIHMATLYRIPDLGHLGHEENPGPFNDIITAII